MHGRILLPTRRAVAMLTISALIAAVVAFGHFEERANAQAVTPWPACGGGTTQECVSAFTVDGGAPPTGVTVQVFESSASVLDVFIVRDGGAQNGVELSPALSTASDIHVELNTGTFDPLVLAFTGAVQSFVPALNSGTGNTAAFDVSPIATSWKAGCTPTDCGTSSTRADAELAAVAVGRLVAPTTSSAAVATNLRGAWLETDAQAIGAPTLDTTADKITFTLAAPRLEAGGTANDDGSFTLFTKDALLQTDLGFANPATLTSESFVTTRTATGELTAEIADAATRVTGGVELSVSQLRYSAPQIDVTRATTSAGRPPIVAMAHTPSGNGYWLADSTGGVWPFGDAGNFGSLAGVRLNLPIVGMAPTASGNGYYLVASDGGVFSFGDAVFFGSTGSIRLNQPIVGMTTTTTGLGYWLVASDGGVFSFGDAVFRGSTGSIRLNRPVVNIEATPDGGGYWLVATDGGVFSFGNAVFRGSTGSMTLNQPIFAMEKTPNGAGYWLVAADGGVFSFGNAVFHGSLGSLVLNQPITAMAVLPDGSGYRMGARDGGIFAFNAAFLGSRVV